MRLASELLAALKGGESAAVGAERKTAPPGGAVPPGASDFLKTGVEF